MNKILSRQLKKVNCDYEQMPRCAEEWKQFLRQIESTYAQHEKDRYLIERSFEIASQEMTEQMKANKEISMHLAQSSKLAAIGTLASGVAHELNNPLAGVRGFVELLLQKESDLSPKVKDTLKRVLSLTDRMTKITRQLLNLSHKSEQHDLGSCDLQASISDIIDLSTKQFELHGIKIIFHFHATNSFIVGDLTRMAGVFQNLLSNSRDAFLSGGGSAESRLIEITVRDMPGMNSLEVTFTDNAGGIPAHILPQIFDPFFTTKSVGSGTGLGLSLIRSSLQEVGGSINVFVEEPRTTFKITLKNISSESEHLQASNRRVVEDKSKSNTPPKTKILYISTDERKDAFLSDFDHYLDIHYLGVSSFESQQDQLESYRIAVIDTESHSKDLTKNLLSQMKVQHVFLFGSKDVSQEDLSDLPTHVHYIQEAKISRADFLLKLSEVS